MMTRILLLTAFAILGTQARGQKDTGIIGSYSSIGGMMRAELNLKKDGTYSYEYLNWESGNGRIYYGQWTRKNDTLVLNQVYYRQTKGVGRSRIKTKHKKHQSPETTHMVIKDKQLCNIGPDVDCLQRREE